ncbi:unnamed protein product [Amoebophrya sp. A120]|nr:unnamed protein product [Amoebophrya sp. A120]|eukprot:GSA120T00025291001.1
MLNPLNGRSLQEVFDRLEQQSGDSAKAKKNLKALLVKTAMTCFEKKKRESGASPLEANVPDEIGRLIYHAMPTHTPGLTPADIITNGEKKAQLLHSPFLWLHVGNRRGLDSLATPQSYTIFKDNKGARRIAVTFEVPRDLESSFHSLPWMDRVFRARYYRNCRDKVEMDPIKQEEWRCETLDNMQLGAVFRYGGPRGDELNILFRLREEDVANSGQQTALAQAVGRYIVEREQKKDVPEKVPIAAHVTDKRRDFPRDLLANTSHLVVDIEKMVLVLPADARRSRPPREVEVAISETAVAPQPYPASTALEELKLLSVPEIKTTAFDLRRPFATPFEEVLSRATSLVGKFLQFQRNIPRRGEDFARPGAGAGCSSLKKEMPFFPAQEQLLQSLLSDTSYLFPNSEKDNLRADAERLFRTGKASTPSVRGLAALLLPFECSWASRMTVKCHEIFVEGQKQNFVHEQGKMSQEINKQVDEPAKNNIPTQETKTVKHQITSLHPSFFLTRQQDGALCIAFEESRAGASKPNNPTNIRSLKRIWSRKLRSVECVVCNIVFAVTDTIVVSGRERLLILKPRHRQNLGLFILMNVVEGGTAGATTATTTGTNILRNFLGVTEQNKTETSTINYLLYVAPGSELCNRTTEVLSLVGIPQVIFPASTPPGFDTLQHVGTTSTPTRALKQDQAKKNTPHQQQSSQEHAAKVLVAVETQAELCLKEWNAAVEISRLKADEQSAKCGSSSSSTFTSRNNGTPPQEKNHLTNGLKFSPETTTTTTLSASETETQTTPLPSKIKRSPESGESSSTESNPQRKVGSSGFGGKWS